MTELEAGSDGRTLTRGIAANAATLAAMSVRGVMSIAVARVLGGDTLGAFLLAFAWMDVLSTVGVFGLDHAALTFIARARGFGRGWAAEPILDAALRAALAISVVPMVAVLVAVRAGWPPSVNVGGLGLALTVMAPTIPALALGRVCASASRGLRVMDVDLYAHGITGTLVMLAGLAALLLFGVGEVSPSLAVTVGTFAALAIAVRMAVKAAQRAAAGTSRLSPPGLDENPVDGLLRFAAPVAGTSVLGLLLTRLDVLLLGFFVGSAPGVTPFTVGAYAAAAEWAGGLRKLRQVFDQAFAPIVAEASGGAPGASASPATAQARLEQVARWILLLVCPVVALTALSGGAALSIYGAEFRAATPWLIVLVAATGSHALLGLFETVIMVKRPSLNVVNALVAVVVQAVLSVILIPRIGALGAALGTLCAYGVQATLRAIEVKALEGWAWPWHAFVLPVGASLVALAAGAVPRYFVAGLAGEAMAAGVFVAIYGLFVRAKGLVQPAA